MTGVRDQGAGVREELKMPEWMEPYRELITNTGGDSIENLMNDHDTTCFKNIIRAGLIVSVDSQICLLMRLRQKGLLK